MIYVIDANNLAGKMKLLGEKDFDKKLIEISIVYFANKKNKIYLVFDSVDPWGDKYEKNNLIIIYAPKNELFRNADDKIIDLFHKKLLNKEIKDEISLVTDDQGIIQEILKISEKQSRKINIIRASDFARRLIDDGVFKDDDELDGRGLDSDKINKLSEELLEVWKEE